MRTLAVALLLVATPWLTAQDLVYYKFESGGGLRVVNYAPPSELAFRDGKIIPHFNRPAEDYWTPGKFGLAFKGDSSPTSSHGAAIDTGFVGDTDADLTAAGFFRIRVPATQEWAHVFGVANAQGFRLQLRPTSIGVSMGSIGVNFPHASYWTWAHTRWVHVAVVVDAKAKLIQLYLDGQPEGLPQRLDFGRFPAGPPYTVGDSRTEVDLDEVRFALRAAPPAEIARWASTDLAADGGFERACHPQGRSVLLDRGAGGAPTLGNAGYGLAVYGLPPSAFALALGSNRLRLGGEPLPFDLGIVDPGLAGCLWHSSSDLGFLAGGLDRVGVAAVPLPIPSSPTLVGVVLYSQALLLNPFVATPMMTNAFATAIGH